MRRLVPLLLTGALGLVACGGGDDAAATTAGPTGTDAPAAPATVPPDVCEDVPDPADYPEGQPPPAIRPCTIPTELVVQTIRGGVESTDEGSTTTTATATTAATTDTTTTGTGTTGDTGTATPGPGGGAAAGDTIYADYVGFRSEDGAIFDESYSRGAPLDFVLGQGGVIPGWDQGFLGVRAGQMLRLDVPAELAYGDSPPAGSDIQPGDALTFVAEIRAVVPAVTAGDAPLDLDVAPSIGATEVTTTDITAGDGVEVAEGMTALVHVLLMRGDNQVVIDDTWQSGQPLPVVIEDGSPTLSGLIEGLKGMRVGGTRVIAMPPALAFGDEGAPLMGLPAGTDLVVVAKLFGAF